MDRDIVKDLDDLRRVLPEPFGPPSSLDDFFNQISAQKLIGGGDGTINRIVKFLHEKPEPVLANVAILLLSRFAPEKFYQDLMTIMKTANKATIEAVEAGFWMIGLPKERVAKDLVDIAKASGNYHLLLLLQRPVAKVIRMELIDFIRDHRLPVSLYSLWCYEYAMDADSIPFISVVAGWVDIPELSATAGLYLLKFGSKNGLIGIRAGLIDSNEHIRSVTYYGITKYLSKVIIEQSGYDPKKNGNIQKNEVDVIINGLM